MEIVIIIIFYSCVLVFGWYRGLDQRSKAENIYYLIVIAASFTIVILQNMDFIDINPIKSLTDAFYPYGLIPY